MSVQLLALPGVHYIASRFLGKRLQSAAFDAKYRAGQWGTAKESEPLAREIGLLACGGNILSLGCGSNALGQLIDPFLYDRFVGVDLSYEALEIARRGAAAKAYFFHDDMESFLNWNTTRFQVVVFPESIYYVPLSSVLDILTRIFWRIPIDTGCIVVTISDPVKHAGYIKLIRDNFRVDTDQPVSGKTRHLLIFRSKS